MSGQVQGAVLKSNPKGVIYMPANIKAAIAGAFLEISKTKSVDKITVKDLVEGLSHFPSEVLLSLSRYLRGDRVVRAAGI